MTYLQSHDFVGGFGFTIFHLKVEKSHVARLSYFLVVLTNVFLKVYLDSDGEQNMIS